MWLTPAVVLAILLTSCARPPATARSAAQPISCPEPPAVDTEGWRTVVSHTFGARFQAPSSYRLKVWEVRSGPWTDQDDWWRHDDFRWSLTLGVFPRAVFASPDSAASHPAVTERTSCAPITSGRHGKLQRFRSGSVTPSGRRLQSYVVVASWALDSARALVFQASAPDSAGHAEQRVIVQSLQFFSRSP